MCRRSSKGLSNNTNSYERLKETPLICVAYYQLFKVSVSIFKKGNLTIALIKGLAKYMCGNVDRNGNGNFGTASKYVLIYIR